jgi:hypothetical protein
MKKFKASHSRLGILWVAAMFATLFAATALPCQAQSAAAAGTAQVYTVITNEALKGDGDPPTLEPGDARVRQGKTSLKVDQLIPARGDHADLQLFILIDDTLDSGIGNSLNDIRDFINAQPATTQIGVGYMSNATIQLVQNFTADHALAAKSVRLPLGRLSTMDSPYLSLISLVKAWPEQKIRREILMVSDGIDRLRAWQGGGLGPGFGPTFHSMPTISPDVDSASELCQRYNAIVYSIYATGVGRSSRNYLSLQNGQNSLSKLTQETGGDLFSLGVSNLVSFRPYLDRLQKILNNQYYVVFQAAAKKKAGLQRINFSTEVPNAEIVAADNVWVPAAK